MHLALVPVAFVLPAIFHMIDAISVLPVVLVLSHVHSAIGPGVLAIAIHCVVFPIANVAPTVWPLVDANSVHAVFLEFSEVILAVDPFKVANPVF